MKVEVLCFGITSNMASCDVWQV